MKHNQSGFSLIELMITISIFAILVAMAAPSFNNVIVGNKLASARDNLVSALQFAKTEAISRNTEVAICPSTDSATCSGSEDWSDGWIIYEDTGAGTTSTVGTIIRVQAEVSNIEVVHNGHRNTLTPDLFIRYIPRGYASDSSPIPAQTVGFCDPEDRVEARTIIIGQTTGSARAGVAADVVCP
jgi:type IV fimbrial biogenesis protein FimT